PGQEETMRLDRYLSNSGVGTRKEVKKLIKQGRVFNYNKRILLVCQYEFFLEDL
ncbi:MAG: hypothetical protein PWP24_352, partial [Clostridiales bacterium]|nr:hypothetical protein [Clostridiales bacterium]